MKKRKRKPRGFWAKKENQKEFLDSLLRKYRIGPEKLTSTMIRENGGRRLEGYYAHTLEMLEAHYGEISLLDRPRVPWGAWKHQKNRIEAVREAVERLGKRPERVSRDDLIRIGLDGLLVHGGLGIKELMREAGYDVPDPVSWKSKEVRAAKIRELVDKAGGVERVTLVYIKERARGLVEYYSFDGGTSGGCRVASADSGMGAGKPAEDRGQKSEDGRQRAEVVREKWRMLPGEHIPILYWILRDAGYDVSPDDCLRGLNSFDEVMSRHGHLNHSLAEALVDDWIYGFVGMDHMHDVIYPGQRKSRRYAGKDCDFVLFPPEARKNPHSAIRNPKSCSLWVEYAGFWHKSKSRFVKWYKRRMRVKKALAKKAGISLVVITPEKMKEPESVWEEMVLKAPWLGSRRSRRGRRGPDAPSRRDGRDFQYGLSDRRYVRKGGKK